MRAVRTRFAGYRYGDGRIEIADMFSDGRPIPERVKRFVYAHERFGNDADAVMFGERVADNDLYKEVNGRRFADALLDMPTDDAKIAREVYERFAGTKYQGELDKLIKEANKIIQSGEYRTEAKRSCAGGYRTCIWG